MIWSEGSDQGIGHHNSANQITFEGVLDGFTNRSLEKLTPEFGPKKLCYFLLSAKWFEHGSKKFLGNYFGLGIELVPAFEVRGCIHISKRSLSGRGVVLVDK